ncbi:probable E3 ubiquitin-protein ligase ZFP1 [Cornus florida]|uniref:probable E3 ubiquitin-protein ligase ZFP1 n=1 Tax=Cornus florida TaxID=4283 RepID=UPI00289A0915|nr:probable E3 ubiquitin-protein ligase ZFP1 [Cornus florida]XP_059628287.1 probable E3 ubiquitin-protein ligase ZFP1 [Cornus florida]XP_059628288.1 probable E3 ubiquitin-protein ligase ZFP1 [Cornus florida]XP_059628289.1 probable E3 ubiquitin-protein ligase ZFP1 [Cornus florida]XP_059628290.1 probable E3 ubiquitin-protein ligase ZFP1 [Cornus florida]XP_059628291.1 probable E3 ubiquitin-protein ligase ZFP1 [Cornus florida]XP_059628292.1 probable E3 ubiquitin-protein ligase ZFP1 [Cornus florid
MGHRHFNSFNTFEINQDLNQNHLSAEQPYMHMGRIPENGSFVYQMDNVLRGEVQRVSRWNSDSRGNERPPSSVSTEVPHSRPAFSGSFYDPSLQSSAAGHLYMVPESNAGHAGNLYTVPESNAGHAGNLYTVPESNAGHAQSTYYNWHTMHEIGGCLPDPVTSTGRGPFKRKSPGISVAGERGSTSRFYGSGSSSGVSVPMQEKTTSNYQNIMSGPIGLPHQRGGSFSIGGEDSSRNVRSRSGIELEANPMRTHSSSYSFHHYHSTTRPTNYAGATDLTYMNADQTTRQWNFNPLSPAAHGRILSADTNGLNNVSNQFLVRGSAAETGGYHPEFVSIGNPVSSSQYPHGPSIQAAREGCANNSQRATPSYRAGPSYPRLGREAASSENGRQLLSETYSSRHLRPSSAGGWRNSYRNGRSRIATERFQSISSVMDAHNRMGSEALMTMDRSALYYGSSSLFDQYRHMRLDIDDMSYEELLALEERIGNVNTGLAGDMISKCLTQTMHCSLDENHEEGTCSICLDEYKNEEEIGTMKKCGHNYHVVCIRKWLSMKNVCPICKAPAVTDCSSEE